MKIIISEQQLQRIIKEFYKKRPIVRQIRDNYGSTISDFIVSDIQNYYRNNNSKSKVVFIQDLAEFINETMFKLYQKQYRDFYNDYIENIINNNLAKVEGKKLIMKNPKTIVIFKYDGNNSFFDNDKLNEAIRFTSNKISEYINEVLVDDSYDLAPTYSGEEIKDDLQKRIYDWEHSKTIIERLYHNYMVSDLVDEKLFKELKSKNYIEEIFNILDKAMERSNFTEFNLIKEENLEKTFGDFLDKYINFFQHKYYYNTEQFRKNIDVRHKLPIEIFMGKIFNKIYTSL